MWHPSGTGKRFDRKKVRIAEKVEPFSSKFFYVHIEAVILQKWQTTHFKACSKWLRMAKSNMLIYFKYEQKYLSKVSCSNFFPDPIFAVRFCIQEKVESSVNNFKRRVFNSQSLFNGGFKFLTMGMTLLLPTSYVMVMIEERSYVFHHLVTNWYLSIKECWWRTAD